MRLNRVSLWIKPPSAPDPRWLDGAERGKDYQSVSTWGLFPAGEGAGYAGGIVSAAVDGLKCGRAIVDDLLGRSSLLDPAEYLNELTAT